MNLTMEQAESLALAQRSAQRVRRMRGGLLLAITRYPPTTRQRAALVRAAYSEIERRCARPEVPW